MFLAIEMIDTGILVSRDDRPLVESPGYALLAESDLETIRFGDEARRSARRHPRRVENVFWDRLDAGASPNPLAGGLRQVDLAYGHLRSVLEIASAEQARGPGSGVEEASPPIPGILAVPGSFDSRELGLLVGIAEACGIAVRACVDAGVAAALERAARGTIRGDVVHVDLLLHRALMTHLRVDEGGVRRIGVESCAILGAASIETALARRIAELFVRRTRFDPLHDALSEQALQDALPACLEALASTASVASDGTVVFDLAAGTTVHSISVDREALAEPLIPLFEKMSSQLVASRAMAGRDATPPTILYSSRWRDLPGLEKVHAAFREKGQLGESLFLPRGCGAKACLDHRASFDASPNEAARPVELWTRFETGSAWRREPRDGA